MSNAVAVLCILLGLLCVQEAGAYACETCLEFDLTKCSPEKPCCIHAENTSVFMGSLMQKKTFCHIEYPVRSDGVWTKKYARERDKQAREDWESTLQSKGCKSEECTGYICAKWFPRCFYINETHMGPFRFEVCRQTCEDCLGTCTPSDQGLCASNPSQFEMACTSDGRSWRADMSKMILAGVSLIALWLATV